MKGRNKDRGGGRPGEAAPKPPSSGAQLRTYFLAGVLVTAPFAVTIYLAWALIDFVDTRIKPLIPRQYNPETYLPFGVPGIGLIVLIVGLTLIGYLTAGLLGRFFIGWGERLLARMPVVRSIYAASKQIIETVFSQSSTAFRQVVLIEYPRRGIWTIAFVVGEPGELVQDHVAEELVTVMVPTTPNPTSGFLLFMPAAELKRLDISVEDGMKMILSIGMVAPERLPAVAPAAPARDKVTEPG
jgi:uncharacterized membrane protein